MVLDASLRDLLRGCAIDVGQLPPCIVGGGYEVSWIVLSQDGQCWVIFALFDVAVRGEVATGQTSSDEVFAGEQAEGTCEVVVSKMNLGQPECVCIVVCTWSALPSAFSQTDMHTTQCQDFVSNVDGRIMLPSVQRILSPCSQELVHHEKDRSRQR